MRVLAYGEVLWDLIDNQAYLGGAPLNFSAHVAQLGYESSIISSIGKDELGRKALEKLKNFLVDTSMIQRSNKKPTGTVKVELIEGQPKYQIIKDVAYDFISIDQIDLKSVKNFDVLYFGSLIQRSEVSRDTLDDLLNICSFNHVFCDLNLRKGCFTKESLIYSLAHCTILKMNEDEVRMTSKALFNDELDIKEFNNSIFRQNSKIEILIVTLGAEGCLVFSKKEQLSIPGAKCELIDAIGAGDAFSAAFLTFYMRSNNLKKSAELANQIGAFVASSNGAIPKYSKELKELLY